MVEKIDKIKFVENILNLPYGEEEMEERREFYGKSEIEVFKIERRK